MVLLSSAFFLNKVFKKIFQEHYHIVKRFRSRSCPNLNPNYLEKVISRRHKSELSRKDESFLIVVVLPLQNSMILVSVISLVPLGFMSYNFTNKYCGVDAIEKLRLNSRIKLRMYVRLGTIHEKLSLISRNWCNEK